MTESPPRHARIELFHTFALGESTATAMMNVHVHVMRIGPWTVFSGAAVDWKTTLSAKLGTILCQMFDEAERFRRRLERQVADRVVVAVNVALVICRVR